MEKRINEGVNAVFGAFLIAISPMMDLFGTKLHLLFKLASEKRISSLNISELNNADLGKAIIRVYEKVVDGLDEIENAIKSMPNDFNNLQIMSDERKLQCVETFKLRPNDVLKPKCSNLMRK